MNDKLPPRGPFGIPGERTVIRPNPGGRRPVAPQPPPGPPAAPYSPVPQGLGAPQPAAPESTPYLPPTAPENTNPDEWIETKRQAPQPAVQARAPEVRIDELVAPNENPILRSAGPLLLLLGRLRVALARASFASLMEQVADAIKFFEKDIRSAGISEAQANSAKYIICATADDIVQNIPTEDRHVWAQYSMLSRFFGERIGGVRFFDELTRLKQDPVVNYDLLELQHTCLTLGFHGIHRTSAGGVATLQQIQRDLYETLRRIRPKVYRELSPRWQGQNLASRMSRVRVPWWGVLGFAGLLLFGIYFTLLYWLTGDVDAAAARLAALNDAGKLSIVRTVPQTPPPFVPPEPDKVTQLQRICAALGPEVAADKASAEQTANQITVRVGNVILFDSGSATVLDAFKAIAARVAGTLDKEEGFIKVVGHTDNTPISSHNVRFPSNYHLSVERAKSVAALFRPYLAKPDRLQTEGKGETAPIADNRTPDGRAKNRRVEILIPRTDTGPVTEKTCPR
ncbi:MAG TPA: type VI secretion system protein TssL, long form [Xanthobacteraceae bacterium]|nr:type VI secretion system protein TssL, long form [Xanthobacteraceae bacterium]